MLIEYKTRDSFGNVIQHRVHGVASWRDETSKDDPYTLRVCRDSQGRAMVGPMVGEFFDWIELPD